MRNEYLRCLVGEYAPASGPAAVRAMSEVASMYLQGRLPGWFNRLFASARLVAPVKKLCEGRAPDVRPVAVGEAERRAAERAVVDNMKEAYVSVLAPSQLGVGIPAGDSVLIHGVRLIAEKLGPRAVIVHTDLRNAYNEAWRRTIIQRHIDCSPLHPVIPALLASLSTDSYLVVDDRSAPLRSEDGVQQGAPLATTSFCVAIHPEVQQCDTTLEVNDGAARFNADDGILVGLPEHVWPALHAFRTSIKASVGLEVRFDKMQAYSADMEAARREAPADIEWPELDGHHGIAFLNVPLGSPEYVQAYMRGKAEELREEVDASLSKLLSAKPSRRYTHALHHHAWALLKHCMQHKAGYWLRNCLPSEVEAFAEAVDATILAAVERVLGVSFDPSTYGTDTNPVVTDFLAELLHDPDPMAAEVATLSEDAVARARSRLHLPTRLKGAGIRRMATVRDAAFIGCMNAILPRFMTKNSGTNTPTPGFFDPQLGSVLGRGSFNANSSARQYDHFLNDAHGSVSYAAEMREAWGRLQAATAGHLGDADARQMEREVEAASGSQKELTAFLDQANNSRLRNEVCALPATCRERILFNQLDAASGMWTVAIPTARTAMTPHELREVAAGYFFLPSPCLAPVVGCQIILPSTEHNPVIVDLYGDALMNLPAPGDAHWRVQHDAIADAFRDHCVHDLGIAVRREVDDLFQQAVPLGNTVPRDELKDLVPDAELSLPAFNVVTGSYDPRSLKSTLLEFKTMRYGVKYTSVPRATAVDRFERSLLGDIQRGLATRDAAWHNTEPGHKGPLRDILDMSEYTGMVFGTVGEVSKGVHRTPAGNLASEAASQGVAESAGWLWPEERGRSWRLLPLPLLVVLLLLLLPAGGRARVGTMVKTKGGRLMNPADAFRKEQRKKEIKRNKLERSFQRDASTNKAKPEELLDQLKALVEQEQRDGVLGKADKLKKRVLQDTYEMSMKRHRETAGAATEGSAVGGANAYGHGAPEGRPEDSVYYHPVHNPTGAPPTGKPQRYRSAKAAAGPGAGSVPGHVAPGAGGASLPVPDAPPLPSGPAPVGIPVPAAPPLPDRPYHGATASSGGGGGPPEGGDGAAGGGGAVLPPPPGPPPGAAPLPPPPGPPPQAAPPGPGRLPPPAGPPPGFGAPGRLPPPPGPPPGAGPGAGAIRLPPPPGPPPGSGSAAPPTAAAAGGGAGGRKEVTKVVSAQTTVVKRPLAQNDRAITSMVPAALRVKREAAAAAAAKKRATLAPGFGLAPRPVASQAGASAVTLSSRSAAPSKDQSYLSFLEEMQELGAFDGGA
eukprot:jgi/Tetstr1/457279/TSEL_043884.t1